MSISKRDASDIAKPNKLLLFYKTGHKKEALPDGSLHDCAGKQEQLVDRDSWGFPKIRGTLLGVPIKRIVVLWGLHLGPLILGNYKF